MRPTKKDLKTIELKIKRKVIQKNYFNNLCNVSPSTWSDGAEEDD